MIVDRFLTRYLQARQSGALQLYTLPRFSLDQRHQATVVPKKVTINCDNTRLSIIDPNGILTFFDLVYISLFL